MSANRLELLHALRAASSDGNFFVFSAVRRPPGRLRRALSQTERVRRIGALTSLAKGSSEGQVWYAAFTNGLAELAWTVSHNVQFAYRWRRNSGFFLVFYCTTRYA